MTYIVSPTPDPWPCAGWEYHDHHVGSYIVTPPVTPAYGYMHDHVVGQQIIDGMSGRRIFRGPIYSAESEDRYWMGGRGPFPGGFTT